MAEAGHGFDPSESNIILTPLRLALETKQSKLQETALDCIHVSTSPSQYTGSCTGMLASATGTGDQADPSKECSS